MLHEPLTGMPGTGRCHILASGVTGLVNKPNMDLITD
jgi:hypothetical protein